MARRLHEYRLFLREFRRHFKTTGAVLPSSRFLARALCRYLREDERPARRVLEVGPGTGAVTQRLVELLKEGDTFDLVELNDSFVRRLKKRFRREPGFQRVAERARVLHHPVEELAADQKYDIIISGLPLNNFSEHSVEQILKLLVEHLAPGGTLSFFQYIAVRPARALVSRSEERKRLQGVGRVLHSLLTAGEVRREWILPNVPPAYVHHVRMDNGTWPAADDGKSDE